MNPRGRRRPRRPHRPLTPPTPRKIVMRCIYSHSSASFSSRQPPSSRRPSPRLPPALGGARHYFRRPPSDAQDHTCLPPPAVPAIPLSPTSPSPQVFLRIQAAKGQKLSRELRYLQGLTRLDYLFVYPPAPNSDGDIVLAGPSGTPSATTTRSSRSAPSPAAPSSSSKTSSPPFRAACRTPATTPSSDARSISPPVHKKPPPTSLGASTARPTRPWPSR